MSDKMREIRIEKVTLNMCMGPHPEQVAKAVMLLEIITKRKAVQTKAKKKIPTWDLRPGLAIGAKITIRGKDCVELLKKLLEAVESKIKKTSLTENGFSFGIKEYIDIPGVKYDPKIGMLGLDVCVTLERPGFRVKRRKLYRQAIGKSHTIKAEDIISFAEGKLGVTVE